MKLKLAAIAFLASTAVASAADLPARTYTKAPTPVVSPAYDWSGFYIGVMGGYAWSQNATVGITGIGTVTGSTDEIRGGFGGGTIGYNFQNGPNWVFGLEVDVAGGSIGWSDSALPLYSFDTKIQALGSVTGRIGYTWGPGMVYFKGGYAWADNKVSATIRGVNYSDSQFHSGWTVGGGLEYMFAPAWSAKVEYMYADFDTATYFNALELGTSIHTIKAGINYHFNWGAPLVAKY